MGIPFTFRNSSSARSPVTNSSVAAARAHATIHSSAESFMPSAFGEALRLAPRALELDQSQLPVECLADDFAARAAGGGRESRKALLQRAVQSDGYRRSHVDSAKNERKTV